MTTRTIMIQYRMTAPGAPLERFESPLPVPEAEEVLVEIAGCGVCHTDLGFYSGAVKTRQPLPVTLGHEISGRIVAVGKGDGATQRLMGRGVIVPAVIPCGSCSACRKGRGSICAAQIFLGNDIHGGFATHVVAPARGLCPVPGWEPGRPVTSDGAGLAELSVMADALTTAYQSVVRSGLGEGDMAVVVGAGGVGGFAIQVAAALGATVAALDVDEERLAPLREHGAALAIDVSNLDHGEVRRRLRDFAGERQLASREWKIFETSGTSAGQTLAFRLLNHGAHLSVVGFTPSEVSVRLSNLMALDATASGNWGCLPERYPEALDLVIRGKIAIAPFVETRPLDQVQEVLRALEAGELKRRVVLIPWADA